MKLVEAITHFGKKLGGLKLFDPIEGLTIFEPPGKGRGYWAGAPSAIYDVEKKLFYLSYRRRRPVGEGRGYVSIVAESKDGVHFKPSVEITKEELGTPSIERSAIVKNPDGSFSLYISYVDPNNNKWRIDLIKADRPEDFDAKERVEILTSEKTGTEGVKDPWVTQIGGMYFMFVPYGPKATVEQGYEVEDLHKTGNVFVTGKIPHPTALAVSHNGVDFKWLGSVLEPGDNWDKNVARFSCLLYDPPVFYAFYDGRTGIGDFYEDRTGYAMSLDLKRFYKVSVDKPILESPWGTKALRYLDAVRVKDKIYFYYECSRKDGSHELRLNQVKTNG